MLDNKTSGGSNFTYRCKSPTPCSFYVTVVRSRSAKRKDFLISSMNLAHEGCTGSEKATLRQAADSAEARKAILENPNITAVKLQSILKDVDGVDIPVRMCHRVRENLLKELDERYAKSYGVLKALLTAFQQLNPSSFADFEVNDEGEFLRAFLLAPYAKTLQNLGPNVMGIDSVDYKCKGYKGKLLVLVTTDGNNETVMLALALSPATRDDNYAWFFRCCQQGGLTMHNVPLFCDPRTSLAHSLLYADPTLEGHVVLVYSVKHMIEDMAARFGSYFGPEQQAFIWRAQDADTKEQFDYNMQRLRLAFPQAAMYLDAVTPEKWAKYTFVRRFPLYGWKTTNFGDTDDATVTAMLDMAPLEVFRTWMEKMMKFLFIKKDEVGACRDRGLQVTPFAQNTFATEAAHMCHHDVLPSDPMNGVAYVSDSRSLESIKRRVCIREHSCSCVFMDQHGIPCRHFQAALNFFNASNRMKNTMWNVQDAFHRHYRTDAIHNMLLMLPAVELPLEEHLITSIANAPPSVQIPRPPQSHAQQQLTMMTPLTPMTPMAITDASDMARDLPLALEETSAGVAATLPAATKKRKVEDANNGSGLTAAQPEHARKCGRCHEYGHNRRTCSKA
ncbi:TPA: hypothetical protein N0F65_004012 [Lagenidium giganteum]|uniref:SWIM-type domain-containing protein n=1 Tax=Lagenidium giganteum TaxID=4803 RepID=A0AAV2YQ85_9STRA|nr:TPA: hypothetical protein N0F65_004012 [Lagenidium giganteum]